MATKKQNRRYVVRSTRRVLNKFVDAVKSIGNNVNKIGYGRGLDRRSVKEKHDYE